MNISSLEKQLQNNILMFSIPQYPYIAEIKDLSDWYDGESVFHEENKTRWVLDAIKLRRDIKKDYYKSKFSYWNMDIKGNYIS